MVEMTKSGKQGSVAVRVLCAFGWALALLALLGGRVSFLEGVALRLSVPAVLISVGALGLGWAKNAPLSFPALTLVVASLPAALDNWKAMRTVWVESAELCNPPGMRGLSIVALLGDAALAADHRNAVGGQICRKLGKRFADHVCDGELGRIKCEP